MREQFLAHSFGTHMVAREQYENFLLSQPLRLPGLPCSFSGLNTLRGNDERLDWSDVFEGMCCSVCLFFVQSDLPCTDQQINDVFEDVHTAMERRMRMKMPTMQ